MNVGFDEVPSAPAVPGIFDFLPQPVGFLEAHDHAVP